MTASDDHYARTMMFAIKVDELALLFAGEPEERLALLSDTVREGFEDVLTAAMIDIFLTCIIKRKAELERNAMPLQCQ